MLFDLQGMEYKEILKMVSFGHKQSNSDDPDRIGRFGVGFKVELAYYEVGGSGKVVCLHLFHFGIALLVNMITTSVPKYKIILPNLIR